MYAYVRGSLKMSKRTYIRAYMYVYPIYAWPRYECNTVIVAHGHCLW